MNGKGELKIQKIKEGVVIDNITAGNGIRIVKVLGLSNNYTEGMMSLGHNYPTSKLPEGKKDLIKIENKELSKEELNKIALVDETARVFLIKNWEKQRIPIEFPKLVNGIIKCHKQLDCISIAEGQHHNESMFKTLKENPLVVQCVYCSSRYTRKDIKFV